MLQVNDEQAVRTSPRGVQPLEKQLIIHRAALNQTLMGSERRFAASGMWTIVYANYSFEKTLMAC